ncbi:hypothetical protein FB45DRAFT_1004390 [Roridomyces roridus]|uniref:Uncharacterized protein n=1 Tax=Roridomyces roridus TaxID=1738132 RepID=A0AAD7BS95_9AGAR|nr:hypothetical protein FB45DRAFT_1004390 [Roridomyces roridus]
MFFAKPRSRFLVPMLLSWLTAGSVGMPSGSVARPSQVFYTGSGAAYWPNGSTVAVGPAPPPRQHLTSNTRELVERQWSEIYCYDSGTAVDQVWADGCVEDYCGTIQGVQVIGGGDLSMHCQVKDGMSVLMSVTADSGCSFNISTADICIYNFEQPIKECNIGMEKQGGVYSIPGSQWRTDPGNWFGNKTDV